MNEGPGAPPVASQAVSRFGNLISRARQALAIERVWPLLWLPASVILVFLALSWFGIWLDLSAPARMFGVGLFAALLASSFWPLVRMPRPTRAEILGDRPGYRSRAFARPRAGRHSRYRHRRSRHPRAVVAPPAAGGGNHPPYARRSAAAGYAQARPLCTCAPSRFWRWWRAPSWRARRSERGLSSAFDWRKPAGPGPRPASMAGSIRRSIRGRRL